ncbi:MAG: tRNA pseudouridine(38-40) synthase TruA [Fimbriimonadaceae bacterium]|nr:tRNA pseudouridine(38-40) synthase TruA [Fimbriimonadaceae bacterium]
MSTKRIKLVVAYDGTDFCGWAAQAGLVTVQSTLTEAVRQVSGEDCEIIGASRTDSGAHAIGQVCHFDSAVNLPPENWTRVLNHRLPATVVVKSSVSVSDTFHSRFCANDRTYKYRINSGERDPFLERISHRALPGLRIDRMQEAAKLLVGRQDFRAFTANLDDWVDNTIRVIRSVAVKDRAGRISIDIVGTAFMRGQMRRMSGALLEVGLGKRDVESVGRLLDPKTRDQEVLPEVLPAKGLMLMRVRYGRHPKDCRNKEDDGFEE